MEIVSLPVIDCYPNSHARNMNKDTVASLAESMGKIGLRTPITVRPCMQYRNCERISAYEVVSGHHRLEAAHKLGW